jgi:DivIVA domain-containing protein
VGHFVLLVLAALIVGAIVFGGAAFVLGGDRGLTPARPDGVPFDLPEGRPLAAEDVEGLRFDTVVRGYRMSQVDEVLARVADDLDWAYTRIAQLERADETVNQLNLGDETLERPADAGVDPGPEQQADVLIADTGVPSGSGGGHG